MYSLVIRMKRTWIFDPHLWYSCLTCDVFCVNECLLRSELVYLDSACVKWLENLSGGKWLFWYVWGVIRPCRCRPLSFVPQEGEPNQNSKSQKARSTRGNADTPWEFATQNFFDDSQHIHLIPPNSHNSHSNHQSSRSLSNHYRRTFILRYISN